MDAQRLRAPSQDGEAVSHPSLDAASALLESNRADSPTGT